MFISSGSAVESRRVETNPTVHAAKAKCECLSFIGSRHQMINKGLHFIKYIKCSSRRKLTFIGSMNEGRLSHITEPECIHC